MSTDLGRDYRVSLIFVTVGGFLESFTHVTRNGFFANSQTGNIARMGIFLAQGNFLTVIRFLIPVLSFILGAWISIRLKVLLPRCSHFPLSYGQLITLTEIILIAVIGFIPVGIMDVTATVLVSFVCAIQVSSFRHFGNNAFSSTMCTGNLRLATEELSKYRENGDRKYRRTAFMYFIIDIVFCLFASVGYWITQLFAEKAAWFAILPLTLLYIIFTGEKQKACHEKL